MNESNWTRRGLSWKLQQQQLAFTANRITINVDNWGSSTTTSPQPNKLVSVRSAQFSSVGSSTTATKQTHRSKLASNGAKQRTDTHKPTDTQTDKSTVGVKRGSKESSVNCVTIFERQCAHSVICIKSIDDDYYPVHTHTQLKWEVMLGQLIWFVLERISTLTCCALYTRVHSSFFLFFLLFIHSLPDRCWFCSGSADKWRLFRCFGCCCCPHIHTHTLCASIELVRHGWSADEKANSTASAALAMHWMCPVCSCCNELLLIGALIK